MHRSLLVLAMTAALSIPALAAEPADQPKAEAAPESAATAGKSYKPDEPIVKVNGVAVPAIFAEFVRQSRVSRNLPQETMTLDALKDALVAQELLVQDAQRQGIEKEASVAAALEFQRRELLGKAALEQYARTHPIAEEALKAEYDAAKAKAGDKEYRASHILVPTEKEAKTILAQLKKPKVKFEDLAKKYSKDSSAGNGGDLGWVLPANMVPEFSKAMTDLKKGQTTQAPVQTQFGWHIVKLVDERALDFPPFDQLKGRIAGQLQQQAVRRYVQALRAEAKVE